MKRLNKFWSGKITGIPSLIAITGGRVFEFMQDSFTTFFTKNNLKNCGKGVKILRGFKYRYPNNIRIGNNVTIGTNVSFTTELPDGEIIIGDNVVIGRNSKIDFSGKLIIEDGVLLSEGVIIQTHDHGFDPKSMPVGKTLVLKRNSWIGLNATILVNTGIIGQSAIIAANSVVTKEVDSYCIYAGIPAVKLKQVNND
jgi:acetyltransferase-like isoleucine patch superfamily enzyme